MSWQLYLRTTGYNSVRTWRHGSSTFEAVSGPDPLSAADLTAGAKSTTQSHRTPVYYVGFDPAR